MFGNKRAFIDVDDLNWGLFLILCGIGYGVLLMQSFILKGMDFDFPIWVKIAVAVAIPIVAFLFSRVYGE